MAATPYVFLDRDGTLIRDVHHGHRLEDYEMLPGVIDALGWLLSSGFRLAIVTNQSGIGRGIFTRDDYDRYHGRLLDDLASAGIAIDATYMCPHAPDHGCECRKPHPATLYRARLDLGADLARSWVIGDHVSDVRLATNAGANGILLLTGHGEEEASRLGDTAAHAVLPDLSAAARHIAEHVVRGQPGARRG